MAKEILLLLNRGSLQLCLVCAILNGNRGLNMYNTCLKSAKLHVFFYLLPILTLSISTKPELSNGQTQVRSRIQSPPSASVIVQRTQIPHLPKSSHKLILPSLTVLLQSRGAVKCTASCSTSHKWVRLESLGKLHKTCYRKVTGGVEHVSTQNMTRT